MVRRISAPARVAFTLIAVLSTVLLDLAAPGFTIAKKSNPRSREVTALGQTSVPVDGQQDEYIVSSGFVVTHSAKKKKNNCDSGRKRRVCADATVRKGDLRVSVYPALGVRDHDTHEEVRGQVYGVTNAAKRKVRSMLIGGALLQAQECDNIRMDDEDPVPTEKTFRKVTEGYSPWTAWFNGANDCWMQTGHNYFVIKLEDKKRWDSWVWGEGMIKL